MGILWAAQPFKASFLLLFYMTVQLVSQSIWDVVLFVKSSSTAHFKPTVSVNGTRNNAIFCFLKQVLIT
jgi:hypothetical protein